VNSSIIGGAGAILLFCAITLAELSLAYVVACIVVTWAWQRSTARRAPAPRTTGNDWPSVAVLKPLCGLEPDLDANLRSFCRQTYPRFEVIMGARDGADDALAVARRAAAEAGPHVRVAVGGPSLGPNQKVNTLAHLGAQTSAEIVVIADSDIRVDPGYLAAIVEPLADPTVGVVTCIYRGVPTETVWSRLGALAINEWFLPSVLVSRSLGSEAYCSGSTIAMRREVLDAIGGFRALAPLLADDHELGARIRRLGLRTVVSHYEVQSTVDESSLSALCQHELRWMRTIRTVHPLGHACSVVTYAIPMTLPIALFAYRFPWLADLPLLAVTARLALHWVVARCQPTAGVDGRRRATGGWSAVWLVPIRDFLSFGLWAASFANRRVVWRHQALYVERDGVLRGDEEVVAA
jgi:ceramide glucosyltransferase